MCNIAKIGKIANIARILAITVILAMLATPAAAQSLPDLPVRSLEPLSGAPPPGTPTASTPAGAEGLDAPRTLSLSLTHPTPLRTVLELLFRGTAYTTVTPASLRGAFAGELRNVTLRQALEAVLAPSGLHYHIRGTVIHVVPRDLAQEGRR